MISLQWPAWSSPRNLTTLSGTGSYSDRDRYTLPNPKYTIDNEATCVEYTCVKGQPLNEERPDELSSRLKASFSKLLEELRKPHRIGNAREGFNSSLPGHTIFEQATGGCQGTVSAGITGFRHLGGTEDTDTVLGATKAKMFTDVSNARCFGSARNWRAWVHLITEQVHYYKA